MKKVLSILLALVMLTSSMSNILVFAADTSVSSKITVEDTYAFPGGTVDVEVALSNNPGIYNLLMSFEYDSSAMNLIAVSNGTAMSDVSSFTPPKNMASGCSASWYYIDEPETYKDGSLVVLTFEVLETAEAGESYSVSVTNVTAEDVDGTEYDISVENGKVSIIDYIPGDVNGDSRHTIRKDVSEFNQYIVDGCKYDPLGYAVQINENAGDVNDDNKINIRDVIQINKYIVDGCTYDPNGYAVKLLPHTPRCQHTSLTAVPAKEASCTVNGNIAYWDCDNCDKVFSDAEGKVETNIDDTVIKAQHTPKSAVKENEVGGNCETKSTYDEVVYCSVCNAEISRTQKTGELGSHILDANGKCTICQSQTVVKLSTPANVQIKYDTISWNTVENASSIIVSAGEYSYKLPGAATECKISKLYWTDDKNVDIYITDAKDITVSVKALGDGVRYSDSDSGISNKYFYVPQTQNDAKYDSMDKWAIGNGYNLITNGNLDTTKAKSPVFNRGKLLTLYNYNENGYTASGDSSSTYTSFSSLDELMLHLSVDSAKNAGFGITNLIGLNLSKSIAGSVSFTSKKYNIVKNFEGKLHTKDFRLQRKDIYSNAGLENCLSDEFLKMVNGELNDYGSLENYNYGALALDIYNNYGTHVILGVSVGGKYDATITYGTDSMKIAGELKTGSSTGGNGSYDGITAMLSRSLNFNVDGSYNMEDIEENVTTTFSGGNAGLIAGKDGLQDALSSWESSVEGKETSLFFSNTENSVVSIHDLLLDLQPDGKLANAYKKLIENNATASYNELYDSLLDNYPSRNDRLLKAPENNVLTIDLSPYQKSGSLENAYDPNLINGILTVYPVMFNQSIDKIVIKGNFDHAASKKLIDGFTVQLSNNWNDNNVDVVVENLGALCTSEYGIVDDKTKISNNTTAVITYSGINAIRETDGTCYYYYTPAGSDEEYAFAFDVESGETLDFSTSKFNSEGIYLPTANKRFYSFTDWYVLKGGTATPISESDGKLTLSYDELVSLAGAQSGEPIYLYASWIETPYTITLNNQSADIESGTKSIYSMGDGLYKDTNKTPLDTNIENKPCITVPKKNGYTFKGYYPGTSADTLDKTNCVIDANGVVDLENSIFADFEEGDDYAITLYAYWEPNVYTITLKCENDVSRYIYLKFGIGFYTDAECEDDPIISGELIDMPEKTGYVCTGYYYGSNVSPFIERDGTLSAIDESDFTVISKDITITAKFSPVEYYVVYNANKPSNASNEVTNVPEKERWTYGDEHTLATKPNLKGWTFDGWYKDKASTGTRYEENATINEDFKTVGGETQNLYAKWTANTYTVKYHPNGGAGATSDSTHTYDKSSSLSVNSFTPPTGYSFGGWKVDLNGTKRDYNAGEKVLNLIDENNGTIDLHAHWTVNKTAVTLDPNGGTVNGEEVEYIEIDYNSTYGTLATPKRDGYEFLGWYDESGNKIFSTTSMTLTEAHTLTATWKPKKYTVVFDANGGNIKSGAVTTAEFTYEGKENMTISSAAYTRTGYSFDVWCLNADGTGEPVAAETIVSETWLRNYPEDGKITVYAKWNHDEVTVKLKSNATSEDGQDLKPSVPTDYDGIEIIYGTTTNTKLDITIPSLNYYNFIGWYDENGDLYIGADGYLKKDWDLIDQNKSATLYAHWKKDYSGYTYISTPTDLSKIGTSGYYFIVNNITLNGTWTPISSFGNGIIDGGDHTIYNLKTVATGITTATSYGFIVTLNSGATVKNIKFNNATLTADYSGYDCDKDVAMGCVAAINRGTISNVHVNGSTIKIDSVGSTSGSNSKRHYAIVGGICGYNYGTVSGCTVDSSTIYAHARGSHGVIYATAGGIIGKAKSNSKCNDVVASNYTVSAHVHGANGASKQFVAAGGIVGTFINGAAFTNYNANVGSKSINASFGTSNGSRSEFWYKTHGSYDFGYAGAGMSGID